MELKEVSLKDRYDLDKDQIILNGTQALVRLMLMQKARDRLCGNDTAGLVTGYRGSPMGSVDFQMLIAKKELSEAGIEFKLENDELAKLRCVEELMSLTDPAGNILELFYGRSEDQSEFKSSQEISAFITHGLGLGHIVFGTLEVEAAHTFYTDVLGFGDSDIMRMRFSPDPNDPESVLYFMHCDNPRHHTVAMMQAPTPPSGLVHAMVEVETAEQVVDALDRAVANNIHISSTLGRHMNDKMFSFYMQTPAGFMLEFGYDAIQPDWDTFETTNSAAPSYWGHEFNMPEA